MDSHFRILLVDGDNANLLVMQQILDSAHEVEFAFTAREAAFKLATSSFDLIISGYDLPDMTLPDFFSSIRRITSPRELPIIVMSDDDDPAVEENSFRLGAQDFISKNSRIGVIERRIMRVLELYQCRADMEQRYQEQEEKIEKIRQNIVEAFASIIEGRDQNEALLHMDAGCPADFRHAPGRCFRGRIADGRGGSGGQRGFSGRMGHTGQSPYIL